MSSAVHALGSVVSTEHDGVMRVGGTRVTLESVVSAFLEGATAEEIQMRYPALRLADTYAVIAWYLANRRQADRYVAACAGSSAAARRQCAARFDPAAFRARLLARSAGRHRCRAHA